MSGSVDDTANFINKFIPLSTKNCKLLQICSETFKVLLQGKERQVNGMPSGFVSYNALFANIKLSTSFNV